VIKDNKGKVHIERRISNRVSSAFWPEKVRKVVATGKAAQRRRDWIIQGHWRIILVDLLAGRVLLISTTLLVVASSLLVALLGLRFWYLLLFPLLLFTSLLTMPAFIARPVPVETLAPTLSAFVRERKSSPEILSLDVQERSGQPEVLLVQSNQGILSSEAPVTPMPIELPLIRVLETYDVRSKPGEYYLKSWPGEASSGSPLTYSAEKPFWMHIAQTDYLGTNNLSYGPLPSQIGKKGEMPLQEIFKPEQREY
jgi:hypothetical protein